MCHVLSIYSSLKDQLFDQALGATQQGEGRLISNRSRSYNVAVLSLCDSLNCARIIYALEPFSEILPLRALIKLH